MNTELTAEVTIDTSEFDKACQDLVRIAEIDLGIRARAYQIMSSTPGSLMEFGPLVKIVGSGGLAVSQKLLPSSLMLSLLG